MSLLLLACAAPEPDATPPVEAPLTEEVLSTLSMTRVKADVDELASDAYAGRTPGSLGNQLARDYIEAEMAAAGLMPFGDDGYAYTFALSPTDTRYALDADGAVVQVDATVGTNLVGILPGADLADEYIVLMAHHDHLGVTAAGDAYNGAFDDITAVAAMLELARLFQAAGVAPRRSILFIATDAEESGLQGAAAWIGEPAVPLDSVVFGLALDPLGRPILPDYWPIVLLGLERSPALQDRFRSAAAWADMHVSFINRAPIPLFGGDQDTFHALEEPVPAGWFVSPGMTWYHTVDDTAETIDYRTVRDHLRYLAQVIAWLGSDDERYEDLGPQELSRQDAADGAAMMEGVLGSAQISAAERSTAEDLRDAFSEIADGGDSSDYDATYLNAMFFLLFELTENHPGEVPPPFPE